jgi:3-hydroxy acid dehydrogenase/malonic semialdehyde reductase
MGMLKDKIVFITGATAGIGEACAFDFAREGANLILCARRIERLEQLVNKIKNEFDVRIHYFQLDVRDRYAVESEISALPGEWKNIDILVNNAGLARGFSKMDNGDIDAWEEMIDTNVKGLLYVSRLVLPLMTVRNKGHVINIGSVAGHEVYPNGNVYCATKFAVHALSKGIRYDLLDKKIRVTTIAPGLVETEFSEVRFSGDKERAKQVYKGIKPLVAKDISDLVLFAATRPEHVNISEIEVTPTAQGSSTQVFREG